MGFNLMVRGRISILIFQQIFQVDLKYHFLLLQFIFYLLSHDVKHIRDKAGRVVHITFLVLFNIGTKVSSEGMFKRISSPSATGKTEGTSPMNTTELIRQGVENNWFWYTLQ